MTKLGDNAARIALRDDDTTKAVLAYAGIRAAIVLPDDMEEDALRCLRDRVVDASERYGDAEGKSNAAFNKVLKAYADYLGSVMWERDHVG